MSMTLIDELSSLGTPVLADGCLRTNIPIRCAPATLRPLVASMRCAGRARPVRHAGSIDDIVAAATAVRDTERRHLEAMGTGRSFRAQVRFGEYLSRRARDAGYSFRQHLEDIQAAGEA